MVCLYLSWTYVSTVTFFPKTRAEAACEPGNLSGGGIGRKKEDQSSSSFANAENFLRDDLGSSLPTCDIPMRVKWIVQDISFSC